MSGKVTLSVRITEELDEWARDEARLRERTVGEIVEAALRDAKEKVGPEPVATVPSEALASLLGAVEFHCLQAAAGHNDGYESMRMAVTKAYAALDATDS